MNVTPRQQKGAGDCSADPSRRSAPRRSCSDKAKTTPTESAMQSRGRVVSLVPALPPPPIPAECDLTGNTWFALPFETLRKWSPWRRGSDLMRARNVMLWGAGYSATPAGSLPDDDDELAEAAGFGMDTDAWLAAKAEILSPWQLHADGRWYCPLLTEIVLEAWGRVSDRRRKEAARKANQRARARGLGDVVTEEAVADVQGEKADVPRDTPARHAGHRTTRQDRKKQTPKPPAGALPDLKVLERFPADVVDAMRQAAALHRLARATYEEVEGQRRLVLPGTDFTMARHHSSAEQFLHHIAVELVEAKP